MRDPSERAISALYYIAMSQRRVAAVNAVRAAAVDVVWLPLTWHALAQLSCGWEVPFMGRKLELERPEHRTAFAEHGFSVRHS